MASSSGADDSTSIVFEGQQADKKSAAMKAYEQAIRPSVTDVLFGRVTTASIISMLGLWTNPPAAAKQPPNMEELPAWYQKDWVGHARRRAYTQRFLKDTALITAVIYLMEWVENGTKTLRGGKDDSLNSVLGGASAGTLWAAANYFNRFPHNVYLPMIGGVFGYVNYSLRKAGENVLLEQQKQLEREIMRTSEDKLHKQLDPNLLRDLIRQKREQMLREMQQKQAEQSGTTAPQQLKVPDWVNRSTITTGELARERAQAAAAAPGSFSPDPSDGSYLPPSDPDRFATLPEPPMRDDFAASTGQDVISGLGSSAGGGQDRSRGSVGSGQQQRGGWWSGARRTQQQQQGGKGGFQETPPGEMVIREESDVGFNDRAS